MPPAAITSKSLDNASQSKQPQRGGGGIGADLQRLLHEDGGIAKQEGGDGAGQAVPEQCPEPECETHHGSGKDQHEPPRLEHRRYAFPKEREHHTEQQVQPGSVVVEVVPVREHAVSQAVGSMEMLELVGVERANLEKRDAEPERRDRGEHDHGKEAWLDTLRPTPLGGYPHCRSEER